MEDGLHGTHLQDAACNSQACSNHVSIHSGPAACSASPWTSARGTNPLPQTAVWGEWELSGLAASRGEGTTIYAIGVVTDTGEPVDNIEGVLGSVTIKIRRALAAYLRFKREYRQGF